MGSSAIRSCLSTVRRRSLSQSNMLILQPTTHHTTNPASVSPCPQDSVDCDYGNEDLDHLTTAGLGLYDVLCGRHKCAFNNVGNRRFRVTVSLSLERYIRASSRKDKSVVIKSVVAMVHGNGGRFLQRRGGAWVELSAKHAHEKAGHALRDMASVWNKTELSSSSSSVSSSSSQGTLRKPTATTFVTTTHSMTDAAIAPIIPSSETFTLFNDISSQNVLLSKQWEATECKPESAFEDLVKLVVEQPTSLYSYANGDYV